MTAPRATGPPGNDAGAGANRPRNVERPPSNSDVARLADSEVVHVVHVTCGMVTWRRVFITAESAWTYGGRMERRGHEVEVRAAVLVGGALR